MAACHKKTEPKKQKKNNTRPPLQALGGVLTVNCFWLVTTNPATEAEVRVDMAPEIRAEKASLLTSPARVGASCDNTPIWVPREPRLANPQRA